MNCKWKPDFTKDDPWEGVPVAYPGYVPTTKKVHNRPHDLIISDILYEQDIERMKRGEAPLQRIMVGAFIFDPGSMEPRFPTIEEINAAKKKADKPYCSVKVNNYG